MQVRLPDGSLRPLHDGATVADLAADIGPRLAKDALIGVVDGAEVDLDAPLHDGASVEIVLPDSERGLRTIRHSTAHIMAQAVLRLWPGATFAIGPAIENGFYYDFELPDGDTFSDDDLDAIDAEMRRIIAERQPFVRTEKSPEEALELMDGHPYKQAIIRTVTGGDAGAPGEDLSTEVSGEVISFYRNSDTFVDMCVGPHVPHTGRLGHFALQRVSGAYWRGREDQPMLQRVYGTAWHTKQALRDHLHRLEEAAKRDHRKLANELDLLSFPSELGGGLAVWHPKGGLLRTVIEDYSRRTHLAHDYDIVASPHVAKAELWETSRHLDFYAEGMYPAMELDAGHRYFVKPMNCPFHILVFASKGRSYRDLPMRLFELGTVYRYERSGVIHGLLRARGFTQDDSHIFSTEEQLGAELQRLLDFVLMVLRDFGFDQFEADLSTRPEKFVGEPASWDRAEEALRETLEHAELPFEVAEGEGAFYGPKIDIHVRDAIGRRWQLSTLQVDFAQPINFDLGYATSENTVERPVMVHRALLGSIERFVGILVEHYAGAFPGWLAPVQATIVPVADRHVDYAKSVADTLASHALRVEVDDADDTVGEKIRRAITQKHPAILVVGDDDVDAGTVGVRLRDAEGERRGVKLDDAVNELTEVCRPPR